MKRSWIFSALAAPLFAGCVGSSTALPGSAQPSAVAAVTRAKAPHASTVVVVIMENRDYDLIIGSKDAPYINQQLLPQAALMTNSHAITHPSEPNYLAFFSGSTQGVTDDSCPHTFSAANAGEELIAEGATFDGYSESMPHDGFTGCYSGEYARKHNPWVNFTNVPATSNLIYKGYVTPSSLTIVVPNLCHDMHDCSTQTGDRWLEANLPKFLSYDKEHDGLLILTWDEADPDKSGQNQIATLLMGPMIKPGKYAQNITHYSTLRTIEDIFRVACTASACRAHDLKGMWR